MPTIRKVYLYEETHLPQKGWMQGCMVCGIITSRLLLFDTKYDTKNKKKSASKSKLRKKNKHSTKKVKKVASKKSKGLSYKKKA